MTDPRTLRTAGDREPQGAAARFEAKWLDLTGVEFTPEENARTFTDWTDAIAREARVAGPREPLDVERLAHVLHELDGGGDGEHSYTFTGTIEELAADILRALATEGEPQAAEDDEPGAAGAQEHTPERRS